MAESDFLKYIAERVTATMVYAGVEVASAGLFHGVRGRQIAGRFCLIPARPFSNASQQDQQTWEELVVAFEENLRLLSHRRGTFRRLRRLLYQRTGGHIGSLANLTRKAAISAIIDGQERIDRRLLNTTSIDFAAEQTEPDRAASKKTPKKVARSA